MGILDGKGLVTGLEYPNNWPIAEGDWPVAGMAMADN